MGRILEYLGISEEGQSKDVLTAEKILEGMQKIYAESPDTPKKDFVAVPLAEMVKVFIENVKNTAKPIEEKPVEEEFPYKVGDIFAEQRPTLIIYNKINKFYGDEFVDMQYDLSIENLNNTSSAASFGIKKEEILEKVKSGEWVKVEEKPQEEKPEEERLFKVGDVFYLKDDFDRKYLIKSISSDDKVEIVKLEGSYAYNIDVVIVNQFFREGEWIKFGRWSEINDIVKPEETPPSKPEKPSKPTLQPPTPSTPEPPSTPEDEQMTCSEIKDAIKGLTLIAKLGDESAKEVIKKLKNKLKTQNCK